MLKLFTKTWINDYSWLKLAMKSVIKLCDEGVDWTIVGDNGSRADLEAIVSQAVQETGGAIIYKVAEVQDYWPESAGIGNGYLSQQWVKMNAHMIMGDDLFWNWDSDVIAVKRFSSRTFIGKSEKPVHWFSQLNSIVDPENQNVYRQRADVLKELFGLREVSFEWMRCMPIPMFGQILRNGSNRREWKSSFEMMRKNDHRISEFNIIGQFSHLFFPDAYEWKNAEAAGPTWAGGYVQKDDQTIHFQEHAFVAQGWSWGGIPPCVQSFVSGL